MGTMYLLTQLFSPINRLSHKWERNILIQFCIWVQMSANDYSYGVNFFQARFRVKTLGTEYILKMLSVCVQFFYCVKTVRNRVNSCKTSIKWWTTNCPTLGEFMKILTVCDIMEKHIKYSARPLHIHIYFMSIYFHRI